MDKFGKLKITPQMEKNLQKCIEKAQEVNKNKPKPQYGNNENKDQDQNKQKP